MCIKHFFYLKLGQSQSYKKNKKKWGIVKLRDKKSRWKLHMSYKLRKWCGLYCIFRKVLVQTANVLIKWVRNQNVILTFSGFTLMLEASKSMPLTMEKTKTEGSDAVSSPSPWKAFTVHLICGLGLQLGLWLAHKVYSINLISNPTQTLRLIWVLPSSPSS